MTKQPRNRALTREQQTRLIETIALIDEELERGANPTNLLASLVTKKKATSRFTCGTNEIRMHDVRASCTAGSLGMLRNWQQAARRRLNPQSDGGA